MIELVCGRKIIKEEWGKKEKRDIRQALIKRGFECVGFWLGRLNDREKGLH